MFGNCSTTQTLNIALSLQAWRKYGESNGRTNGRSDYSLPIQCSMTNTSENMSKIKFVCDRWTDKWV